MTEEEVKKKVFDILMNKVYDANIELSEGMNLFNDLGFDSLDEQDFVFELENEFGIMINPREMFKTESVHDYIKLVYNKVNKK